MNHYTIEVIFDDDHQLIDVNVRGPGQHGQSYDVTEFDGHLRDVLDAVAVDIEDAESYDGTECDHSDSRVCQGLGHWREGQDG